MRLSLPIQIAGAVALAVGLSGAPVHAAPPPTNSNDVSCRPFLDYIFTGTNFLYGVPDWINVAGTTVTARGTGGFHAFSMAPSYQIESGLANPAAGRAARFRIAPNSDSSPTEFRGQFVSVFPGRGNGDEDLTTLVLRRDGVVEIILDRWGGGRSQLSGVSCYSGHTADSFVLTGYGRSSGFGITVYTFVIGPAEWLI